MGVCGEGLVRKLEYVSFQVNQSPQIYQKEGTLDTITIAPIIESDCFKNLLDIILLRMVLRALYYGANF
jgi:hypothetical protein